MAVRDDAASGSRARTLRAAQRSRAIRLYRAAVPLRVRLALRDRLSPQTRDFLARRLTQGGVAARVSDQVIAGTVRLRHRGLGRSGHAVVRAGDRFVAAQVRAKASPTLARRETLDRVMEVLQRAGVTFFCVRGYGDHSSTVGVPAGQRAAALDALAAAAHEVPGYLAAVVGGKPDELRIAYSAAQRRRVRTAHVVRYVQFVVDPQGLLVLGDDHGCDVEFWAEAGDQLIAPRPNRVADTIPRHGPEVQAAEEVFLRTPMPRSTHRYPTRQEFLGSLLDDITFPVDAVYTWVDGSDPAWRARRDRALGALTVTLNDEAANESRYITRDELRYSLRSLEQFAPWINHIWLVTDDQVPDWLDPDNDRITVVSHRDLFGARGTLPTFNSHAIESQLHRIDGLAEHFLYFNDDVLLGRPVLPQMFFDANGATRFFPSTAKIDPAPPSILDAPVTAAGKNNRELVMKAFGRRVTYKMKHCPHALRRSIMAEIEERFTTALDATSHHQFRHPDDVSLPSSLYHYHAHLTGRATIGSLRYMYTNLADPDTATRLRLTLARRDYDVLCLNDTDSDAEALARQKRMLDEFLSSYYPVAAPWERPAP